MNRTNNYKHGAGLPRDVIEEITPVYSQLSEDNLLSKCLDGKIQNPNESLNGMFWERVLKDVFVGTYILQLGINDAMAHFNIGYQPSMKIFEKLGISPGQHCLTESLRELMQREFLRETTKHRKKTSQRGDCFGGKEHQSTLLNALLKHIYLKRLLVRLFIYSFNLIL